MDSSVSQILILLVLLLLSGIFSSAETALTTYNKIRMRALADEGNKRASAVLAVTENSGKMLSAILIGNNIVNTAVASPLPPQSHTALVEPPSRSQVGL